MPDLPRTHDVILDVREYLVERRAAPTSKPDRAAPTPSYILGVHRVSDGAVIASCRVQCGAPDAPKSRTLDGNHCRLVGFYGIAGEREKRRAVIVEYFHHADDPDAGLDDVQLAGRALQAATADQLRRGMHPGSPMIVGTEIRVALCDPGTEHNRTAEFERLHDEQHVLLLDRGSVGDVGLAQVDRRRRVDPLQRFVWRPMFSG